MSGLDVKVEMRGAAEIAALWARAPEITAEELERAVLEGSLLLEREVKERTPVGIGGGGGLRGSIAAHEPRVLADRVIGAVGTSLSYAVPVELGTRPHFPPIEPLADWARHKLGVPEEEATRVGYLIARKIARQGTEGVHMFRDAFKASQPQIEAMLERATARIRDRLAGKV